MKISIDTKEDNHEDIRKVIKMLQHIVGDNQEVFTNEPQAAQEATSPFTNIFGDTAQAAPSPDTTSQIESETAETGATDSETQQAEASESSQSTEDLFAELFSEEEIKKMDVPKAKEEEEDEEEETPQSKGKKKYDIEFY